MRSRSDRLHVNSEIADPLHAALIALREYSAKDPDFKKLADLTNELNSTFDVQDSTVGETRLKQWNSNLPNLRLTTWDTASL
jgi:hypothetical protein